MAAKRVRRIFVLFLKSKMGLTGFTLLIVLLSLALLFPIIGDKEAIANWRNYEYWVDYPKKAPPCWSQRDTFPTQIVMKDDTDKYVFDVRTFNEYSVNAYRVMFEAKNAYPAGLNIRFYAKYNATTYVYVSLLRPDGQQVNLTESYESARLTSTRTFFGVASSRYDGKVTKNMVSYVNNPQTASTYVKKWLESQGLTVGSTELSILSNRGFQTIFSVISPDIFASPKLLEGHYVLIVDFISLDHDLYTELDSIVIMGGCYGLMGTDVYGRDLTQGIWYGLRWALIIGLMVAFVSTIVGGLYGITSGYLGGLVDEIMLRVAQVIYSIPVLPLLIILSYILKPSIWNLIALLIVFGWPGVSLVTRSMAIQIKEEIYVESARAIGASSRRIIFRYVLPQTLPYLFASMALSVPGAILTEAAVSFLGLGDPTKITWGRILNEAQANMATVNGYWWWVITPGLMIVVTGMTFILIGYALDTVLNPRLKR